MGNIWEKEGRVSFTLSSLRLPSLDTFHILYFNFLVSGPLPVGFAQHPSAACPTGTPSLVLPCSISQQLPMLFFLLCCPDHCYLFDFCPPPLPLLRPLVIPAAPALPLRELPFLLLPTVPVQHWNFFDFQVLYFSACLAARVLPKYCCTVDLGSIYCTVFCQLLSAAGKGDHTQNCSLSRQEAGQGAEMWSTSPVADGILWE